MDDNLWIQESWDKSNANMQWNWDSKSNVRIILLTVNKQAPSEKDNLSASIKFQLYSSVKQK